MSNRCPNACLRAAVRFSISDIAHHPSCDDVAREIIIFNWESNRCELSTDLRFRKSYSHWSLFYASNLLDALRSSPIFSSSYIQGTPKKSSTTRKNPEKK